MLIGGKDRPINMGMNVWISFCELRGISITEMGEQLERLGDGGGSGAELRDIIWASLKDGARKAKQEFEYDNFDVGDWMSDITADAMQEFMKAMGESFKSQMPSSNGEAKAKKKAKVQS